MKKTLSTCLFWVLAMSLYAQKLQNYDAKGSKMPSNTDLLQIAIEDESKGVGNVASVSFSGIAGSIVGLVVDFISSKIAKRQQSFAATYSSGINFILTTTQYQDLTNGKNLFLHIRRYMIDDLNDNLSASDKLVADYKFKIVHFGTDYIQLKLQDVLFKRSRARINNDGEHLSISIDLKLSYTQPGDAKIPKTTTLDLGESTIRIPIIKPGETEINLSTNHIINEANFQGFAAPTSQSGQLIISASIAEVNLDHLEPSIVETLFKNNSSDITSVLKSFFSSGSNSATGKN